MLLLLLMLFKKIIVGKKSYDEQSKASNVSVAWWLKINFKGTDDNSSKSSTNTVHTTEIFVSTYWIFYNMLILCFHLISDIIFDE